MKTKFYERSQGKVKRNIRLSPKQGPFCKLLKFIFKIVQCCSVLFQRKLPLLGRPGKFCRTVPLFLNPVTFTCILSLSACSCAALPLVPPLGRALLVLSTFVLAALPTVSLVALVVVFVVLPPPLVQVVCLAPSRELLHGKVGEYWLQGPLVRSL